MRSRVLGWLVLLSVGAIASACVTGPHKPSTLLPSNPYKFPSADQLHALTSAPPPSIITPLALADVDRWQVENTRARLSQGAAGQLPPFVASVRDALAQKSPPPFVSDALSCAAEEAARFVIANGASPSAAVQRFVAARCGCPYSVGFRWLLFQAPDRAPDADVERVLIPELDRVFAQPLGGSALGLGYRRGNGLAAFVIAVGQQSAIVQDAPLTIGSDGRVTITGMLERDVAAVSALVNRGAYGVVPCERDDSLRFPKFRFSCAIDPHDESAWIQLLGQSASQVLSRSLFETLAVRQGANVNTLQVHQKPPLLVTTAADFQAAAVVALNEARALAKLPRVVEAQLESEEARIAAPHFFHAEVVQPNPAVRDAIALGLLAGWEVTERLRGGGFLATLVAPAADVNAWLEEALASPMGRDTLLSPDAGAIALGATFSSDPPALGVLALTYAFSSTYDHRKDAEAITARIHKARKAADVPTVAPNEALQNLAWKQAQSVLEGVPPEEAIQKAIQLTARLTGKPASGLVVATPNAAAVEFPGDLLSKNLEAFAVSTTHYDPADSRWGVHVTLMIWLEGSGSSR